MKLCLLCKPTKKNNEASIDSRNVMLIMLQVTVRVEFQLARSHLRPKARTKASYLIESTRQRWDTRLRLNIFNTKCNQTSINSSQTLLFCLFNVLLVILPILEDSLTCGYCKFYTISASMSRRFFSKFWLN